MASHKLLSAVIFYLALASLFPHYAAAISFNYPSFDNGSYTLTAECPQGINRVCLQGHGGFTVSSSAIQLTHRQQMEVSARAFYSEPMRLWDNSTGEVRLASFNTSFNFTVGTADINVSTAGDGMTFFLTPYPMAIDPNNYGSTLGVVKYKQAFHASANSRFVALELDTFMNEWDPSPLHAGIDVNSLKSDVVANMSSAQFFGQVLVAVANYSSETRMLNASVVSGSGVVLAQLSWQVNLSDELPVEVVVGISAATGGGGRELHQINSWSFTSTHLEVFPPPKGSTPDNKANDKWAILSAIVGGTALFLLTTLAVVGLLLWRRAAQRGAGGSSSDIDVELAEKAGPRRFPFSRLAAATRNFDEGRRLGSGGSSTVYRAFLADLRREVAIKRVCSRDAELERKVYVTEVGVISQLRHRNLVLLLGWCHGEGEFLLVYEYMPNLSLDKHLFGGGLLRWPLRYAIAVQVASALLYLHEEWNECVVHRDIKCSNILLDDAFDAKLGDFGLARITKHGAGVKTTMLGGTMGYVAPECFHTGKASRESDVYALGVVALEIATGRPTSAPGTEDCEMGLVGWVWERFERGELLQAADQRLEMDFLESQMERLLLVGLWCAHPDLHRRPSVRKVVAALHFEDMRIDLPSKMPVITYATPMPAVFSSSLLLSSGASITTAPGQ